MQCFVAFAAAAAAAAAAGEVCVGMGVFGIYEAALGPMETPEDFEDALHGVGLQHIFYLLETETLAAE